MSSVNTSCYYLDHLVCPITPKWKPSPTVLTGWPFSHYFDEQLCMCPSSLSQSGSLRLRIQLFLLTNDFWILGSALLIKTHETYFSWKVFSNIWNILTSILLKANYQSSFCCFIYIVSGLGPLLLALNWLITVNIWSPQLNLIMPEQWNKWYSLVLQVSGLSV